MRGAFAFWRAAASFAALLYGLAGAALAGPPFLADDRNSVSYRHSEFYVFSTLNDTADTNCAEGPAVEYNFGAAPELQLHLVMSLAYFSLASGARVYGLGDMELGVKYRIVDATGSRP